MAASPGFLTFVALFTSLQITQRNRFVVQAPHKGDAAADKGAP